MRIRTKGPVVGECNICGSVTRLTEDHIPPKGVVRFPQVELMSIVDLLGAERPSRSSRFFQNGVVYRSICGPCNNEKLGVQYDPALVEFSNAISAYLSSSLHLPRSTLFEVKINRLLRSVAGHMLGYDLNRYRRGSAVERLTDYFHADDQVFPEGMRLYLWVYPYSDQVVVKDAALSIFLWKSFATFWLMKFFPCAFMFVFDEPANWKLNLSRLDTYSTKCIDDISRIRIHFDGLPPQRWPEAPTDHSMILYGHGATVAVPRKRKL